MDLKSGMGWELDADPVVGASRPVRPVAMSSIRSSPGQKRLGVGGFVGAAQKAVELF